MNSFKLTTLFALLFTLVCTACNTGDGGTTTGNPLVASEDTSTSGAAAGAVGGALAASNSSSSLAFLEKYLRYPRVLWPLRGLGLLPTAVASDSCPTYKTAQGAGCSQSGDSLWLEYSSCRFSGSLAEWSGTQELIMASGGPAACGTFPKPVGGTLNRQYVTVAGSTTPSSVIVENIFGTIATIDDHSADLDNFNSDSIATMINSGYGSAVVFNGSGERTSLTVGHRLRVANSVDQSITGTVQISEVSGQSTQSISGSVQVYHNLLQVIATSQFVSVIHSNTCCLPVGGKIVTTFQAGSSPPLGSGSSYVGATETLTFSSSCGIATLQTVTGATLTVNLSRCF